MAAMLAGGPDLTAYTPVLLPLHDGSVDAGTSSWRVDEVLFNGADRSVRFYPYYPQPHPLSAPAEVGEWPPLRKLAVSSIDEPLPCRGWCRRPHPGAILWVERTAAERITAYDRVFEAARDQENHGAVVPGVREPSFRHEQATLSGLPLNDNFRTTLRLYNLAGEVHMTLRIYDAVGAALAEHSVVLPPAYGAHPEHGINRWPGYAQLSLERLVPAGSSGPATVVIVAQQQPASFWAFASVTSNTTQRVTIVTP
jgi:hypothetical protein